MATKKGARDRQDARGTFPDGTAPGGRSADDNNDLDADERPGSDVALEATDSSEGPADESVGSGVGWETVASSDREDLTASTEKRQDIAETDTDNEARTGVETEPSSRIVVPDFTGLTVAAVLRAAHRSGVELALNEGGQVTGVALHQDPKPGPAEPGIVCRVAFGRPKVVPR
jgi:hypothetical protein